VESNIQALRKRLSIELTSLHIAAQEQPELTEEVNTLYSGAKAEAKRAKLNYEVTKAEADKKIRLDPITYGVEKITESSVSSAVTRHPEVRKAYEDMIQVEEAADRINALVLAFGERRSMIKVEAELWVQNYWGSPEVIRKDMQSSTQAVRDKNREAIMEKRSAKKEQ